MNRRVFLGSVASGWLSSTLTPDPVARAGSIVGASHGPGHLLRDKSWPKAPRATETADVVIIGGGASGVSAAWRLAPAGVQTLILELEPRLGGTSGWGTDGVVAYPWGAHYLPAPNPEARAAYRLLREMGVVTGTDAAERPIFDARLLCHAPAERLYYGGQFWPGLVPFDALNAAERDELKRFADIERGLSQRRGRDGQLAFRLPIEASSTDPELLALDRLSMAEWLRENGFFTEFLRWYVRYATLDDYGAEPSDVSAWAGLHYFASRTTESEQLKGSRYLVWPEGNGRLVQGMFAATQAELRTGALVVAVEEDATRVGVTYLDLASQSLRRVSARAVVVACPAFVARRLFPAASLPNRAASPWVVANLHVTWDAGLDRAWDTVLYDGQGLGYVDAGHQRTRPENETILTYFRAFGDADVAASRTRMVEASWADWAREVFHDLAPAHPELSEVTHRLDVMVWGHAMPRPRPGFLGPTPFASQRRLGDRVAWAHVDHSGIALFEEAQANGVRAAEALASALGVDLGETWA